jgi:hypothetical protein
MKKNLFYLTAFILTGVIFYLFGSFVYATFDIAKWTEMGRFFTVSAFLFFWFMFWLLPKNL